MNQFLLFLHFLDLAMKLSHLRGEYVSMLFLTRNESELNLLFLFN